MKLIHILGILSRFAAAFVIAGICAQGFADESGFDDVLEKQVIQLMNHGDYAASVKLVESQETLLKTAPSLTYFRNMTAIGDGLTGSTNAQVYWLGRKIIWKVLLKPAPNEKDAVLEVRYCK